MISLLVPLVVPQPFQHHFSAPAPPTLFPLCSEDLFFTIVFSTRARTTVRAPKKTQVTTDPAADSSAGPRYSDLTLNG